MNSNDTKPNAEMILGDSNKTKYFIMVLFIIILAFVLLIPWNNLNNVMKEFMSNGTLTQLFANDSQDIYLKSNVDKLATGNFNLFWNQPTRVANTYLNRGSPLSSYYLPNTQMNPNPIPITVSNNYTDNLLNSVDDSVNILNNSDNIINYNKSSKNVKNQKTMNNPILDNTYKTYPNNILPSSLPLPSNPDKAPNPVILDNVGRQIAKTFDQSDNLPYMTKWKPIDYLYQSAYDNLLNNKDCLKYPASCGGGSGGSRLGEDYIQATKAKPFVDISGNTFYPDSYVGSYFIEPNFDINRPIPYMPNNV